MNRPTVHVVGAGVSGLERCGQPRGDRRSPRRRPRERRDRRRAPSAAVRRSDADGVRQRRRFRSVELDGAPVADRGDRRAKRNGARRRRTESPSPIWRPASAGGCGSAADACFGGSLTRGAGRRRRAARLLAGGAACPRPCGRAARRRRAALRHGGRAGVAAVRARRAQRRSRSRLGAAGRRGARRRALGRRGGAFALARPGARPGRAGAQDPGAARRGDPFRAQADRARLRRRARRSARFPPRPRRSGAWRRGRPGDAAAGGDGAGARPRRAAGVRRRGPCPFRRARGLRRAGDHGRRQRNDPLAAQRWRQHDRGRPRRRRADRSAARPARRGGLARRRRVDGPARRRARLAGGQAQTRRFRRDAGAGRAAAELRHAMAQPVPRRRLCADRPA